MILTNTHQKIVSFACSGHANTGDALDRVASVQSEPGQQNLLIQQPLGRKRGLRQVSNPERAGETSYERAVLFNF